MHKYSTTYMFVVVMSMLMAGCCDADCKLQRQRVQYVKELEAKAIIACKANKDEFMDDCLTALRAVKEARKEFRISK